MRICFRSLYGFFASFQMGQANQRQVHVVARAFDQGVPEFGGLMERPDKRLRLRDNRDGNAKLSDRRRGREPPE